MIERHAGRQKCAFPDMCVCVCGCVCMCVCKRMCRHVSVLDDLSLSGWMCVYVCVGFAIAKKSFYFFRNSSISK